MLEENETGGTSWYFGKPTTASSEPVCPATTTASIQFSFKYTPLSQGSDRSAHPSDTILTHQQSHSPSSFPQSQSHSTRDRDTSSSHTQNIHSSLSNPHPSSSAAAISHSTKHGSYQRPQLPQSPPPSITALKESQDDDHHDPDQLPISNIGQGGLELLIDLVRVTCGFVVELDLDLYLPLLGLLITIQTLMDHQPPKSPLLGLLLQSLAVLGLDPRVER